MICKLCHQNKKLVRSHIIPEFLYKNLYDQKHRFFELSNIPDKNNLYKQKGHYEKLLCDKCESLLSKYENYAKKVFYGGIEIEFKNYNNWIMLKGVDYSKFKLFQLSILWRASVSSLEIFKKVKLGIHEENLRKMILSENPGEPHEYGCAIIAITINNDLLELIMPPEYYKFDNNHFVLFVLCGFVFLYIISNNNQHEMYKNFLIDKEGTLVIYRKPAKDIRFIVEFSKELVQTGKIDQALKYLE